MSSPTQPPLVETVSKSSPFGALLSRTLPKYTGPHAVGVCDIELPVPKQTFGMFTHKSMPHRPAGLQLDTAMFSIFYPVDPSEITNDNKHVVWFPKLAQTVDGFLKMAARTPNWLLRAVAYPVAAVAIYGTTFPAHMNAPLRRSPTGKSYPLMIFSHGVGCSRLMYSAFCGEMASRGWICCAVEHRDGTSPSSTIVTEDGRKMEMDFINWKDLYWPELNPQPEDDTALRHEQIKMRLAEIYEVVVAMKRITEAQPIQRTRRKDSPNLPDQFDWGRWKGSVDTSNVVMSGHSLGGSAAIATSADSRFSFKSVIAMDPAVQRIDPWEATIVPALLTINSEEFTKTGDWARLKNLLRHAGDSGTFEIPGATHPSFSDLPLILPEAINRLTGLKIPDRDVLDMSVRVVDAFLSGGIATARKEADGVRTWDDDVHVREGESVENSVGTNKENEKKQEESRHTKKMEKKSRGRILWCDLGIAV